MDQFGLCIFLDQICSSTSIFWKPTLSFLQAILKLLIIQSIQIMCKIYSTTLIITNINFKPVSLLQVASFPQWIIKRQGTQLFVGDLNLAENRYFSAISADTIGGFRHFRQGSGTHVNDHAFNMIQMF